MTRRRLTPEGAVLRVVLQGLRLLRIDAWRIGVGAFRVPVGDRTRFVKMGDAGLPDVLALVPGRGVLLIECKSATGRLSPEQVRFRDACQAAGAVHVVARGWDDVAPFVGHRPTTASATEAGKGGV